MPDEIKSNAEIVAEKLAAADAKPRRPPPTVFEWLLTEVGRMERDIKEATKSGIISNDSAKIVFKECIRMMVETQAGEMQRQREADNAFESRAAFSTPAIGRRN
jgi:hypothetical protein